MTKLAPREWTRLDYVDPDIYVAEQQKLRARISETDTPDKIRNLRTRTLAPLREAWDAGVFCYLLRRMTGFEIYFSAVEDQDYDAIFTWRDNDIQNFAPVQMKEVVPAELNPKQRLKDVISSLKKYADSKDLVVAIKVNRNVRIEAKDLEVESLPVAEVWLFGATEPREEQWSLFRKLGDKIEISHHELPKA
jgi:hypothetical protein